MTHEHCLQAGDGDLLDQLMRMQAYKHNDNTYVPVLAMFLLRSACLYASNVGASQQLTWDRRAAAFAGSHAYQTALY